MKYNLLMSLIISSCAIALTAGAPQLLSSETAKEPAIAQGDPNLVIYDGSAFRYPIKTKYPKIMQVQDGCSGEGCGFFFTFVPQGDDLDRAEVHIFLPAGVTTAADQEPFVTGENGLIANAGWTVTSTDTENLEKFPYFWVTKVIQIKISEQESGHILLGEAEGQAVQVLLKYPTAMASEYWSGAEIILENLEFDPDFLPIPAPSS